jgi:hypothetical protein
VAGGHGQDGQVLNKEVPYHECSIQDVMIEDLQRQVAELTQRLAILTVAIHNPIFENLYHKPVLVWEHRVWDEWHEDLDFTIELSEISGTLTSLTIVSKSLVANLPNSYYVEEEDDFIEEYFSVDWASPPIYDTYPDEEDLLE